MIVFAVPAFLLAGALAALVPLALHLIRRRPPSRAPLPTSRFLTEDPRTSVRVSRPTDLVLLALRMLLLLLAGAALARPAWLPAPEGTSEVVLLDRSAAMRGPAWNRAVDAARRALLASDGEARGELVLFDTAAVRVPRRRIAPALFDSLAAAPPSADRADYAAALRGVRPALAELRGADSVRVTLLSALRWGGWSDGLAPLRRAAWPGSLVIPDLGAASTNDTASSADSAAASRHAVVIAPSGRGLNATAALAATGWEVRTAPQPGPLPADANLYVTLAPPSPQVAGELRRRAEAGATVVVASSAVSAEAREWLPWTAVGRPVTESGGEIFFAPGLQLAGASGRVSGDPKPGASVIAAWDDGRPAAAAARAGRGCAVFLAAEIEGGEIPFSASYPRALDRLARGCEDASVDDADASRSLDAGARAVLRGQGPSVLAASAFSGSGGGVALGRWLMAAALAVALVETFLAYRGRSV